jgi:hypothetical protein
MIITAACDAPEVSSPTKTFPTPIHVSISLTVLPTQGAKSDISPALLETWQSYAWQDLVIPIPPKAQWLPLNPADIPANHVSVVAAGAISYPTIMGSVELPYGPSFVILQFTGSLDDWLDLERRNSPAGNPIEENSIRDIIQIGLPAKGYRHAVTGTGLTEYYAMKIAQDKLLWITTQDAQDTRYQQVIDRLALKKR